MGWERAPEDRPGVKASFLGGGGGGGSRLRTEMAGTEEGRVTCTSTRITEDGSRASSDHNG